MALFKYFSRVLNLPSAEDTNIGVAATKSVNADVQRVMEDIENEASQRQGRKHKVYTALHLSKEQALGDMLQNMATQLL